MKASALIVWGDSDQTTNVETLRAVEPHARPAIVREATYCPCSGPRVQPAADQVPLTLRARRGCTGRRQRAGGVLWRGKEGNRLLTRRHGGVSGFAGTWVARESHLTISTECRPYYLLSNRKQDTVEFQRPVFVASVTIAHFFPPQILEVCRRSGIYNRTGL